MQILNPNKTDEFYHEAAKNGITIWQDFMFACSTYTNQTDFLDSVAQEVKSQLWRLVLGIYFSFFSKLVSVFKFLSKKAFFKIFKNFEKSSKTSFSKLIK